MRNKRRRLNPIAEAQAKQRGNIWKDPRSYGILAVGMVIGLGTLPAIAENSNPANAFQQPAANSASGTNFGTTSNPNNTTSGSGQQGMNNSTAQDGGLATGVTAGIEAGTEDDLSVVRGDVAETATACANPDNPDGIAAAHQAEMQRMQELASASVNTDGIFKGEKETVDPETGKVTTSAIAGCFTAADEVVNLSILIPPIPTSWSAVGGMLRDAVTAKLKEAQTRLVERGCQVANTALAGALQPMHNYLSVAGNSNLLQDPTGFLGAYIAKKADLKIDQADNAINGILDQLESNIQEQNREASRLASESLGGLKDIDALVQGTLDEYAAGSKSVDQSIVTGEKGVLQQNYSFVKSQYDQVVSETPPTAKIEGSGRDRSYYECDPFTGGNCKRISIIRYRDLLEEKRIHDLRLDGAKQRLSAAQAAMQGEGGSAPATSARSSSTYGMNSTPAPAANLNTPAPQPQSKPSAALSGITKMFGGNKDASSEVEASAPESRAPAEGSNQAPAANNTPVEDSPKQKSFNPFG